MTCHSRSVLRAALMAVACAGLLGACATGAIVPTALEDARLAVVAARDDPAVVALAPAELAVAVAAYQQAEDRFRAEGDSAEVRHLGYLARRRAEIAVQAADRKTAEQEVVAARAERERVQEQARGRAPQESPGH